MDLNAVRIFIYTELADVGAPPTSAAIADRFSVSVANAAHALEDLASQRAAILDRTSREIWMAGPFSAVPTRFAVRSARASYWANCAWDMFGIPAFLSETVEVQARCADCDAVVSLDVDARSGPAQAEGLVHILLPARQWYADIGFT